MELHQLHENASQENAALHVKCELYEREVTQLRADVKELEAAMLQLKEQCAKEDLSRFAAIKHRLNDVTTEAETLRLTAELEAERARTYHQMLQRLPHADDHGGALERKASSLGHQLDELHKIQHTAPLLGQLESLDELVAEATLTLSTRIEQVEASRDTAKLRSEELRMEAEECRLQATPRCRRHDRGVHAKPGAAPWVLGSVEAMSKK